MGTIKGFVYSGDGPLTSQLPLDFSILNETEREMPILLVQIDGDDDSDEFPYSCSKLIKRLIPVIPIEGRCNIKNNYKRWQYPLLVAHARTGHSVQGFTARYGVVVDLGSQCFAGDYVAISRATCLEHVLLLRTATFLHFTSHPEYRYISRLIRTVSTVIYLRLIWVSYYA